MMETRSVEAVIKAIIITGLVFLLYVSEASLVAGESTRGNDDCNQFRGDNSNSGTASSGGKTTDELLWKFKTEGGIESSPAVVGEKIYFGSKDGSIYCLDAQTGIEKWAFPTGGDISSSPLVANGKLYVGSGDKKLYCINGEYGIEQWNFSADRGIMSSPKLYKDKLYFGADDGNIYSIHENNGTEAWNFSISQGGSVWSTPAIKDNLLYIGDSSGRLVCLDAKSGEFIYDIPTDGDIYSSVMISGDDILFSSGIDRSLYRYNGKTGQLLWEFKTGTDIYTSASAGEDRIFFSDYEFIYCIPSVDPNDNKIISPGEVIWKYEAENFEGGSSPLVLSDSIIIGMGETLYSINSVNGTSEWSFKTAGTIVASPVFSGANLYIGSTDGYMYCLKGVEIGEIDDSDADGTDNDDELNLYPYLSIPIIIFTILDISFLVVLISRKRRVKKNDS
ncbi:MAG: PQQ-binding-like beta-propeller repeat protein [Candidatus Thermoplasmatota archaeon]|jgi:outer membrane protein assembly factor BamB|nr:PQQ-binding-like beta-propeller repeat protein [Candidatus Thermoplasmatota archaeon]